MFLFPLLESVPTLYYDSFTPVSFGHWMACCLVETILLHAIHLSAIREQFVNIEEYVSRVINDRVACFMNVQAFIIEDTDFINSRGSH